MFFLTLMGILIVPLLFILPFTAGVATDLFIANFVRRLLAKSERGRKSKLVEAHLNAVLFLVTLAFLLLLSYVFPYDLNKSRFVSIIIYTVIALTAGAPSVPMVALIRLRRWQKQLLKASEESNVQMPNLSAQIKRMTVILIVSIPTAAAICIVLLYLC